MDRSKLRCRSPNKTTSGNHDEFRKHSIFLTCGDDIQYEIPVLLRSPNKDDTQHDHEQVSYGCMKRWKRVLSDIRNAITHRIPTFMRPTTAAARFITRPWRFPWRCTTVCKYVTVSLLVCTILLGAATLCMSWPDSSPRFDSSTWRLPQLSRYRTTNAKSWKSDSVFYLHPVVEAGVSRGQFEKKSIYDDTLGDLPLDLPVIDLNTNPMLLERYSKSGMQTDDRAVINPSIVHQGQLRVFTGREHSKINGITWWSDALVGLLNEDHIITELTSLGAENTVVLPGLINRCLYKQPIDIITNPADSRISAGTRDGTMIISFSYYATYQYWDPSGEDCATITNYRANPWYIEFQVPDTQTTGDGAVSTLASSIREATAVELVYENVNPQLQEKNWLIIPFDKSTDDFLVIQSLEPHVILKVNHTELGELAPTIQHGGKQLYYQPLTQQPIRKVMTEHVRTWNPRLIEMTTRLGSIVHLGAGPIRLPSQEHQGLLMAMYHTLRLQDHEPKKTYYNFIYLMQAQWPYAIQCVNPAPLQLVSSHGVTFASGMDIQNDKLHVFYGSDDVIGRSATYNLDAILNGMICLDSQATPEEDLHTLDDHLQKMTLTTTAQTQSETETETETEEYVDAATHQGFLTDRASLGTYAQHWSQYDMSLGAAFNPSTVSLPSGSKYPYFSVARSPQYDIQRNDMDFTMSTLKACLMDRHFYCTHAPKTLDLYIPWDEVVKKRAQKSEAAYYNKFVGGEDGRLFYYYQPPGTQGDDSLTVYPQLLLSYGGNSRMDERARTQFLIDVVVVFPELLDILPRAYAHTYRQRFEDQNIVFGKATEVFLPGEAAIEKNWAYFQDPTTAQLWVSYMMEPRIVIKLDVLQQHHDGQTQTLTSTAKKHVGVMSEPKHRVSNGCLQTFDPSKYRLNQGTQVLPFYACTQEACKHAKTRLLQSREPVRYVSISHIRKIGYLWYQNYATVFTGTEPFMVEQVYEVPVRLFDIPRIDIHRVYLMSIAFEQSSVNGNGSIIAPQRIGYLDSPVILGFGYDDKFAYSTRTTLQDILTTGPDKQFCPMSKLP